MSRSVKSEMRSVPRPLVGRSDWIRQIQAEIRTVAPYPSSALIVGPSGTGKELIARAIHAESPRADKPFIAVNCAAITGPLFESHMFGHLKGAFTGSDYAAQGCFRAADQGTIFLDEIGELEPELQAKLLRVLQESVVTPVGSHEEVPVDVRVVAATNRDLAEEVLDKRFREDLYYRLAVVSLRTLPLCEHLDDMEPLADYLLSGQSVRFGLPFKPLSFGALVKLQSYSWPGNVRELQNVLERAVMFSQGAMIEAEDILFEPTLLRDVGSGEVGSRNVGTLPAESFADCSGDTVQQTSSETDEHWPSMEEMERRHIQGTLERTDYNQAAAARLLGLDRSVLRRRIKKLGVDISQSTPGRPRRLS